MASSIQLFIILAADRDGVADVSGSGQGRIPNQKPNTYNKTNVSQSTHSDKGGTAAELRL